MDPVSIVESLEAPVDDRRPVMASVLREASGAELVDALLLAAKPLTRELLCDLMGLKRDPIALDLLIATLRDDASNVRASAADAIGKIFGYVDSPPIARRPDTLAALITALHGEVANSVKRTIVQSIALLGDPQVEPILQSAREDPNDMVRGQAEWGLSYLKRKVERDPSQG